jgi:hypothetical protein
VVFLSEFHEGCVDGNAGQPRRKQRIAFEALEMNKGPFKRLLHDIFCILVVPHNSPGYAKDRVCGLFAKDLKGSRIAPFCSGKKRVFLSYNRSPPRGAARFFPVVILQTLCGHAAAPIRQ